MSSLIFRGNYSKPDVTTEIPIQQHHNCYEWRKLNKVLTKYISRDFVTIMDKFNKLQCWYLNLYQLCQNKPLSPKWNDTWNIWIFEIFKTLLQQHLPSHPAYVCDGKFQSPVEGTEIDWARAFLVCDLNRTPNCYGKTWRLLCPFFGNLHLRENLARDCFTSTASTVTNCVQNIFTRLRYCDK